MRVFRQGQRHLNSVQSLLYTGVYHAREGGLCERWIVNDACWSRALSQTSAVCKSQQTPLIQDDAAQWRLTGLKASLLSPKPANIEIQRLFSGSAKEGKLPDSKNQTEQPKNVLQAKKAYRQQQQKKKWGARQQKRTAAEVETSSTVNPKQEENLDNKRSRAVDMEMQEIEDAEERLRELLLSEKSLSDELTYEDVGKYVAINKELLPEIFTRTDFREEQLHPRGGCPGLELELEETVSDYIMYRSVIRDLTEAVMSKEIKHMYLTGPAISGKSISMAAIVNQMRAKQWLVWYIPNAQQLTHGGFFYKNDNGRWDTPAIAKLLLRQLMKGNPERMQHLPSTRNGTPTQQIIEEALQSDQASTVVDAFLEVKNAVSQADNVLIAIDKYQALHSPTDYGEWMSQHHRRVLQPEELRIANAMRLLEAEPLRDGVILCAKNKSGSYSPKLRVPITSKDALATVPRMNIVEWHTMAQYYMLQNTVEELDYETVKRSFFSTNANPKEFRLWVGLYGFEELAA